ncbi:MAG: 50S ribosomal protein L18 [Candidatus Njordarchaeales archaeon]
MPRRFGPRYRVPFRRRREGRTDYRARYKMVISGKIRAVVRKSLRNIVVHFVKAELEGDKTLSYTKSTELVKFGWKYGRGNLPAAYLTGYLAGLKAIQAGLKEAILDIGPQRSTKGNRLYAALKGLVDAGVEIPHSEEILPDVDRIRGEHIANYARLLKKKDPEKYRRQFSRYLAQGLDPEKIPEVFEETLKNIASAFGVEPPTFEEESEEEFEE